MLPLSQWLLRPDHLARLTPLVNISLVIALAYMLADLSLGWLTPNKLPPPATTVAPTQHTTATSRPDYVRIVDWQPFGPPVAQAAPRPVVVAAPETRLNLRLAGIFYSEGGNGRPLALITVGNRPQQVFAVGDRIDEATQVADILSDKVLLQRQQQIETLSLPRELLDSTHSSRTTVRPANPVTRDTTSPSSDIIDATVIAAELRRQIATRPEAVQNLAYATPYFDNNRFAGLRLQPGREPQLFGQLGLHPGDVLLELNGTRLTDPNQGMLLLHGLLQAERLELKVLRNGRTVPLTFILSR